MVDARLRGHVRETLLPAELSAGEDNEIPRKRVLFVGHAYYNTWYLSRELRKLGWKADVLSWDPNPDSQGYYHGEDMRLDYQRRFTTLRHLRLFLSAIRNYDVFHFSNMHGLRFGNAIHDWVARRFRRGDEIRLLKLLGKKVIYTNNGCLDGVSQTSFAKWGTTPVCVDCPWRNEPSICSDAGNLAWGEFRNSVADFQVLLGGNRTDYNVDPRVHEVPQFYCLDEDFWHPDLMIPANYRLPIHDETVKVYHAVGNVTSRSEAGTMRNLKSTHIYLPLIQQPAERRL